MGSWREQALIEAPVQAVWDLVGDPRRYPEWVSEDWIEVTGLPTVEKGARFEQVTRVPYGDPQRTTFEIEELDELHEIRLRCTESGWYSRFVLTEAGGATFADVEIGMDPTTPEAAEIDASEGKRWYRKVAQDAIDGVKRTLGGRDGKGAS